MRDITGNTSTGDGIAIGQNIRVHVDKRSYHKNSSGVGSGRGSKDDEGSALFGFALLVLVGIAFASWQFARYAPMVYLALSILTASSILTLLTISTIRAYHNQPWGDFLPQIFATLGGGLTLAAILISRSAYPAELTEFAHQVGDWKSFFCRLPPYWREFSAMQMLAISLAAVPATLSLTLYAAGNLLEDLLPDEAPEFIFRMVGFGTRIRLVVATIVIGSLALVAQSDATASAWAAQVAPHLEHFFSSRDAVLSLCRG
ncbi:hypothetical protein [Caldimonas sp.]|uniref:hypothetical protein n=1 Tax=Caldimonas sp. TaxID=2838790 RepID=UPI0039198FEC